MEFAIVVVFFFGYTAFVMRTPWFLVPAVIGLLFLRGAAKRDHNFLNVYRRHMSQADIFTPAPISKTGGRQLRPVGYGRMDPN